MKNMYILTILLVSLNVSLFAQDVVKTSNDPKPATEREKSTPKIKLINGTSILASISSLLTDVATSSLRKQIGNAEFEKLKEYGNEINYPGCLIDKIDDAISFTGDYKGSADFFNRFTMYQVATFYSIVKSDYLTVVKIPASENKIIDSCTISTDLYFIIFSSDVKKVE